MMPMRNRKCAPAALKLALLMILAFVARVVYARTLGDGVYLGDEVWYHSLAVNMVSGRGFSGDYGSGIVGPTALKFPVLPTIMAGLYYCFGPHLGVVRIFQSLLGALLVPLAYAITREIGYSSRAGMLAAVGTCIYPYYIFSAGAVYPVVTASVLVAVVTLLLLHGRRESSLGYEAAGGAVCGITILTFGHMALALPLIAWWVARNKQTTPNRARSASLLVLVIAAAVMLPWMARNKVMVGRFGLSTAFEMGLYQGNAPGASWGSGSGIMKLGDPAVMRRAQSLDEARAAKVYWQEFLKLVKADPGRFVWLSAGKAVNFWRFYPNLGSRPITLKEKLVGTLSYGPVMVLGLLWFILDRERRKTNWLMMMYFLATMAPIAISCSQDRYRMPFDVYLIVFASAGIVTWLERRRAPVEGRELADETSGILPVGVQTGESD